MLVLSASIITNTRILQPIGPCLELFRTIDIIFCMNVSTNESLFQEVFVKPILSYYCHCKYELCITISAILYSLISHLRWNDGYDKV